MGITGTWSGFVASTNQAYIRGSFGSGFGTGNFSAGGNNSKLSYGISLEASSVKIWRTCGSNQFQSGSWWGRFGNINFTSYNNLYVSFTGINGGRVDIYDTSGSAVAGARDTTYALEPTININLSNINITGFIQVWGGASSGIDQYATQSFHITQIYFN